MSMNGGSVPTYSDTVIRLRVKELEQRAELFVSRYDPGRPSVILVPGGMGSRLLQAITPYVNNQEYPQAPEYREIWMSIAAILRREIDQVEMTANGEDFARHPMVAAGELSTFIKKYDGTEAFFRDRANYIGFGYDWRKSVRDEAGFLRYFLLKIRTKVTGKGLPDPLPRLTLLAHSQGGLVSKLFINNLIDNSDPPDKWFERFVSVGTPFYGTFTHIRRYFVGEALANLVTNGGRQRVARLAGGLPGPYILLFAPISVLKPRYIKLGLSHYPLLDSAQTGLELDPFAQQTRPRFPSFMPASSFSSAQHLFIEIDRELPQVAHKIFQIRSNATKTNAVLEQTWQPGSGDAHFNAGTNPIEDNGGASDGTVPFWSARLGWIPDTQVFDLVNSLHGGPEHGGLAEHEEVLKIVWELMTGGVPQHGERQVSAGVRPDSAKAEVQLQTALATGDVNALTNLSPETQRAMENGLALC
jgi:lecithin:cholesterol acyltransferase